MLGNDPQPPAVVARGRGRQSTQTERKEMGTGLAFSKARPLCAGYSFWYLPWVLGISLWTPGFGGVARFTE